MAQSAAVGEVEAAAQKYPAEQAWQFVETWLLGLEL
jgi:hypothetical protein